MEVRRLLPAELPEAQALLAPEGWALDARALDRLRRLGGAVGAFERGRMVGFLTFVDTPPYRWVGNVVVDPAQRGAGVGRAMVDEAYRDADRRALYSVEKAVPLYARAGLVAHGEIVSLRAPSAREPTGEVDLWTPDDLPAMAALDREVVGMDRRALLEALVEALPAFVVRRGGGLAGFGIAKTYDDVTEIGPVVAQRAEDAWALVDALMAVTHPPYDLVVHAVTPQARERGFVPQFRAIPMFKGPAPAWDLARYHAVAGLEKG